MRIIIDIHKENKHEEEAIANSISKLLSHVDVVYEFLEDGECWCKNCRVNKQND